MTHACDAPDCPARAVAVAHLRTGDLYFCRHHLNEHADTLRRFDAVVDELYRVEAPTPRPRRNHYQEMLAAMRAEREERNNG